MCGVFYVRIMSLFEGEMLLRALARTDDSACTVLDTGTNVCRKSLRSGLFHVCSCSTKLCSAVYCWCSRIH
jgi:hypothetical protein